MSVDIKQLKDHTTGLPFVPMTHWDAVANKPTIPSNTSDLTNDSGFITGETDPTVHAWAKAENKPTYEVSEISGLTETLLNYYATGETYTQTEVNNLIGAINQFRYEIYADITGVTDPQSNVLYLIGPKGTGSDQYEEYVYANSTFTKIGDTTIDLSDYATTSALTEGLAGKSNTGHTHEQYSLTSHTHEQYSLTSHTHSEYSLTSHTHSEYSLTSHTHTIEDVSDLTEELAGKSNTGHTHTAEEVGALPSSTTIPTATSQLTNDSNFVQSEGITTIWKGTQVQYDAIVSPSNMVLYAIVKPLELVIGSDTIEYGPNMSWNEWVRCSYNTFGWTVGSGDDYIHNGSYVLQTNGTNVLKTDIIDGTKTYSWGTPA